MLHSCIHHLLDFIKLHLVLALFLFACVLPLALSLLVHHTLVMFQEKLTNQTFLPLLTYFQKGHAKIFNYFWWPSFSLPPLLLLQYQLDLELEILLITWLDYFKVCQNNIFAHEILNSNFNLYVSLSPFYFYPLFFSSHHVWYKDLNSSYNSFLSKFSNVTFLKFQKRVLF